jgi:AcrR family transcriptional regulator
MPPRPDVSEERKEQILQAAINVFSRRGIHEARMDDIVTETGLSKGSLYWYFKSKDDIIIAIADYLFGRELQKIGSLTCDEISTHDCLMRLLDIFIEDITPMLGLRPVIYEFYALSFRNKTVRKVTQRFMRQFIDIIEPIVRRGMDSGELTPGDSRQAALAVGASLEGTLLLWAYDPDTIRVEDQLRASVSLTIRGLEAS